MENLDNKKFWKVVWGSFKKINVSMMYKVLTMYYCFMDPDTPIWVKAIIVPALIYLISPFDAVPDLLPGGFIDDGSVITAAFIVIEMYITEEHKRKANEILTKMFGVSQLWT